MRNHPTTSSTSSRLRPRHTWRRRAVVLGLAAAALMTTVGSQTADAQRGASTGLTGAVALQGRTSEQPRSVGMSITMVTLSPGGYNTTARPDGSFYFENLPAGTYTATFSAPGYIPVEITDIEVSTGMLTLEPVALRSGHVTGGAIVGISDITAVIGSYGARPTGGRDAQGNVVDINGDGVVNLSDLTMTLSNFGQKSPQVYSWGRGVPVPTATPTRTPVAPNPTATPTRTPTAQAPTATPTRTPTAPAPTATPTRTPTATPTSGGGSTAGLGPIYPADLRVPDTNYPVPGNAIHVAANGNDGSPGTAAAPVRTVQHGINLAANGGTVVVHQGVYREKLNIWNKQVTVQAAPHEQVWIKGSDIVTGWVQDGTTWRKDGWTNIFEPGTPALEDPAYPMAKYPDLAFVDGKPLTQVSSRAAVRAGTFYVDTAAKRLYIGDNPNGRTVEAGARQNLLVITNSPQVKVRGIGFMHAASNPTSGSGAVFVGYGVTNTVLENNAYAWNAAMGVDVGEESTNTVIRGSTGVYNGCSAVSGWGYGQGTVVEGNYLAYNNQENFSSDWGCGGVKMVHQRNMVWRDNIVENNKGTGLWCDISCYNVTIVRNLVRNNARYGIFYELSHRAIIASNVSVGHTTASGIYVSESSDVQVYNNTVVNNLRSINVQDADRANTDAGERAMGITWDTRNVVVKNNLISHGTNSNQHALGVTDNSGYRAAEDLVTAIDYNGYYRRSASQPSAVGRWALAGGGDSYFYSVADMKNATGQEQHSIAFDNQPANPFFVNEQSDYRLTANSPARNKGTGLPADVASAIGVAPGTTVNLGALVWPGSN